MDYPNDFNTPAFRAGKTIALTRSLAIWISVVFFLIITACGFLLIGRHLKKNLPFLVSIDSLTNEWTVVAYPDEKQKSIPQYQYIQEKLVNDFVKDWFTISEDKETNNDIWQKCSTDECNGPEQFNPENKLCALSCKSSGDVFDVFTRKVLPDYKARIAQANETWKIPPRAQLLITPVKTTETSGEWRVYTNINSSINGNFRVLIFIQIERNVGLYPATFGYYVSKFDSYRMVK